MKLIPRCNINKSHSRTNISRIFKKSTITEDKLIHNMITVRTIWGGGYCKETILYLCSHFTIMGVVCRSHDKII